MTIEEKKNILNHYRWVKQQADSLELEIEALRQSQMSPSAPVGNGDHIQGGKIKDPMLDYAIKLDKLEHELLKFRSERIDLCAEITRAIKAMDDDKLKLILFYKYINCMSWDEICERMSYERSWIFELHGEALATIELKERTKTD